MNLPEIGQRGQQVDVLAGGDIDPGTGGLLSVGELRHAMRLALAGRSRPPRHDLDGVPDVPAAAHGIALGTPLDDVDDVDDVEGAGLGVDPGTGREHGPGLPSPLPSPTPSPPRVMADRPVRSEAGTGAAVLEAASATELDDQPAGTLGLLGRRGGLLAVVGAHPGAGCSTVALVVAEAAAAAGRPVHLIEASPASRSGLAGTTRTELGTDVSGRWRRGERGRVTVDRRADDARPPAPWPPFLRPEPWQDPDPEPGLGSGSWWEPLTVLDLGSGPHEEQTQAAWLAASCVALVCRGTIPGLRAAEQALSRLIGPTPWGWARGGRRMRGSGTTFAPSDWAARSTSSKPGSR